MDKSAFGFKYLQIINTGEIYLAYKSDNIYNIYTNIINIRLQYHPASGEK
jgi:hypothetical protein